MMKTHFLLVILTLVIASQSAIAHLTDKNYNKKIEQNTHTLLYVYSSSCNYCKEFTPVFEKLSRNSELSQLAVSFAKMDGPAYPSIVDPLDVYSYPTILFYKHGMALPLVYRKERSEKDIIKFINQSLRPGDDPSLLGIISNMTDEQRVQTKAALFYGNRGSPEFNKWSLVAARDGYIGWAHVEANTSMLILGDRKIMDFSSLERLEEEVAQVFAALHGVSEESWLKMVEKKKFSIVYFNKHGSSKTKKILAQLAPKIPSVNFIEIDGNHDEYSSALKFLGLPNEENIVAVDKKYDVLYIAPSPYSEENLTIFIEQARNHQLDPYRKTQKTQKPNKLTRENFEEKMNTNQDILLFLYDRKEPISKELMKLFEFLVQKLQNNKNLSLLRCDVGLNEVEDKLELVAKPTPKLIFFRSRMRNLPINFMGKTISASSVLEFIMENTTYDFEDQWAEL